MDTRDLYSDRLSEYLDDEELSAAERAELEAHLTTCASCRTTLAELRAVAARAASLPDAPPDADLWAGIAARLDNPAATPKVRVFPRRFSFTLPQLVAAGLALMVLSGGMVWISRLGSPHTNLQPVEARVDAPSSDTGEPIPDRVAPANFADSHYDQAIADLEKALDSGRSRLDPETVRILEANLTAIDLAIEQSRKALRQDPESIYLNNHFAESRMRKLALLRRATALTTAPDAGGS
jgi:anti-sigma factor RsiW